MIPQEQGRPCNSAQAGASGKAKAALCVLLLLANLLPGGFAAAQTESVVTGPLDRLRQDALSRVNEVRRERGLETLDLTDPLNAAAQAHAEDMARRDYYSHVSPEGEDAQDRYIEHGGSRWRFVAENIATCEGCPAPPDIARVRSFQEGWMQSPEHRHNILAHGLEGFGFGIAASEGRIYAVQTFAGAGTPPGLEAGEQPAPLAPAQQLDEAVAAVNRAREEEELPPLEASEALTTLAERLLAGGSGDRLIDRSAELFELLPGERAEWRSLNVLAAACGGCGTAPVAADVRHFTDQWLSDPQHRQALLSREATHLGFAMEANGEGRKAAAAVVGQHL
ncbi:CAP domain-containing protein [Chelativorans sp. AA-79]|uniref:CAP domain-containing protein n=1 Tax=Chelativorans sp. AA-79 TaxID=3028735 RepID=UPI0023F7022F|nr:CAP domain-containing protein [Chelativorans sp. AA-79]WEX07776.1 CAP domain-containing protein [Chelativorans sp. AA-79]